MPSTQLPSGTITNPTGGGGNSYGQDAAAGAGLGFLLGGPVGALFGGIGGSLFGGGADPTAAYQPGNTSYQPGDIAYQGIGKQQDSLTQQNRSLINDLAFQGTNDQNAGRVTQAGGAATTASAGDQLNQIMRFYNNLLEGSRSAELSAVGGQADQITQQFDQVRNMFSENSNRSGGTASTQAKAPYQMIQQISQLLNNSRNNAAQQEGQLAVSQEGIGLQQEGVGLQQQGLGSGEITQAENDVLNTRQQNNGQSATNLNAGTSLGGSLISALI